MENFKLIPNSISKTLTLICLMAVNTSAWSQHPIGTNLAGITDWSSQRPFTNYFKQARPWFTQCASGEASCNSNWNTGEEHNLDLDQFGWVKSLPKRTDPGYSIAASLVHLPRGEYSVSYMGTGTLQYGLDAKLVSQDKEKRLDVVRISKEEGKLLLQIVETDPSQAGDYIREISIFSNSSGQPAETSTFNPNLIQALRPYKAIRFMDWMATNNNDSSSWDERLTPQHATYSQQAHRKGVPTEIMVELVNDLDKSPWFTLPHKADDNYIRQFAITVKNHLKTAKPIYVEYSNETWNQSFEQFRWINEQAKSLWPRSRTNAIERVANWYGKRSAEVCAIWHEVYSDDPSKVVCVLGSQAANTNVASTALECPLWKDNPKESCLDHGLSALAIAPYFGGYIGRRYGAQLDEWLKLESPADALFQELENTALPQAESWMAQNIEVAKRFEIELIAYEAGQHLVGTSGLENNEEVTNLFIEANRDDRMKQLYLDYYSSWFEHGGGLIMNFTLLEKPSKWGSWGTLESESQSNSSKHDAIMSLLGNNNESGSEANAAD